MSGAELALAIVPLVVVLVEHHRTAWRKTRAVTSSKAKNNQQLDFYEELHAELSLLNITLDRIKPESDRQDLEDSQAQQIQNVLGKNAPHFQQVLDRVMKSIGDLVSEKSSALVQIDTVNQHAMLNKMELFREALEKGVASTSFRDRFRFTRNEKTRSVAMKRIQDGNQRLERILGPSMDIFEHQTRAYRRKAPNTRMRRLSEDLYVKMVHKWPRACSCRSRHVARLCLWNCCCAHDDPNDSDDSLDMVVSIPDGERSTTRWKWQESTIHVAEKKFDHTEDNRPDENHVRFSSVPAPQQVPRASPARDIDTQSFCAMLQTAQTRNSSLQILFEDGKLWQKRSKPPCLQIGDQRDISLKELLGNSRSWRVREKSILAVVLAHAVLHCSEGPWLRADWSKEHVFFFRKDATHQPDLSRPFLTMDFTEQPESTEESDLFMSHSNPALLSLGILLLEISGGLPIESHWCPADLTGGRDENANTSLTAALRLLDNSDADLVIGYRKAVRACLEWEAVNGGREDEDFAKRMYEYIVEPLERELQHGFDITPEQLGLMGMNR